MGRVFSRISFFVNAGVRFIEEHAKLRAMGILWDELGRSRYGVEDLKQRRFRYGVQVNSLGSPRRSRRTTSSGSCWRRSR